MPLYDAVFGLTDSEKRMLENHVQIHRLEYYYDPADYNKVIYRQRKEDYNQRLQTILFLVRAFSEQVIKENNTLLLKNKEDGT